MPITNFNPVADTQISANAPTTNYGSQTTMKAGWTSAPGKFRSILKFDLTKLSHSEIIEAVSLYFRVTVNDGTNRQFALYRMTQPAWVESEATWNIYKTGSSWTVAGGDYTATGVVYKNGPMGLGDWVWDSSAELIALVNDAILNRSGLLYCLLKRTSEASNTQTLTLVSREGASAYQPCLSVTWSAGFVPSLLSARRRR